MARIRQRSTDCRCRKQWWQLALGSGLLLLLAVLVPVRSLAREPLSEQPVIWYAADDLASEVPAFDEPALTPYAMNSFLGRPFSRFWHPGRFLRRVGTGDAARLAGDVNALDEVVNSTWFTNRIGLRPLSRDELRLGAAMGQPYAEGPDRSAPWVIIGAKTAGVTPGFKIRDGRGDIWLLKFDPPSHPGMTIRAGVISNLIFHAAGYNTPADRLAIFSREDLVVGPGAEMKLGRVGKVPMTEANLDSILAATGSVFDGQFHALASRYLDGIPLGPFNDQDTRGDDPNDLIKHENRRELRAVRVFGAWVNHFDTKMQNTLDMYLGEPGSGHVRHYLIDFASTLGGYADQPVRRFGYEYGIDLGPVIGRAAKLGAFEDKWVAVTRPDSLPEIGLFDVATFEPQKWKPDLPHSGMANLNRRDGYWAAKIISAFTAADLQLIVAEGQYHDPRAAEFMVKTLLGRQEKIVRYWFAKVPPLDYFQAAAGGVQFMDLAVTRGYAAGDQSRYQYRLAAVDAQRGTQHWTAWQETTDTRIPVLTRDGDFRPSVPTGDAQHRFLAVEVQVNRGRGWSASTRAYFSLKDGHTVAVER